MNRSWPAIESGTSSAGARSSLDERQAVAVERGLGREVGDERRRSRRRRRCADERRRRRTAPRTARTPGWRSRARACSSSSSAITRFGVPSVSAASHCAAGDAVAHRRDRREALGERLERAIRSRARRSATRRTRARRRSRAGSPLRGTSVDDARGGSRRGGPSRRAGRPRTFIACARRRAAAMFGKMTLPLAGEQGRRRRRSARVPRVSVKLDRDPVRAPAAVARGVEREARAHDASSSGCRASGSRSSPAGCSARTRPRRSPSRAGTRRGGARSRRRRAAGRRRRRRPRGSRAGTSADDPQVPEVEPRLEQPAGRRPGRRPGGRGSMRLPCAA